MTDFRHAGRGFATHDPIREFCRHGFLQGTDETSGDEVERCERGSSKCNALTCKGRIDCKRRLIEHRPSLGILTCNSKGSQPIAPVFAAPIVNQHVLGQIGRRANGWTSLQEGWAACGKQLFCA